MECPRFLFMHSPVQKKYAVKTAHGARGVGEKISPTRLHSPMQRKNVGKVCCNEPIFLILFYKGYFVNLNGMGV